MGRGYPVRHITNSAIGLRQIFPWQIKRIFFISRCLPNYYLCVQYSKRAVINQNFAEKKNSAFRQNIRKTESIQFGTASYLSSSISSMLIFKGSTPTGSLTKVRLFLNTQQEEVSPSSIQPTLQNCLE